MLCFKFIHIQTFVVSATRSGYLKEASSEINLTLNVAIFHSNIYNRIATILNLKMKHNTNVPSYTYRVATVELYSSNREEGAGGGEGCNPFLREGHPSPTTSEMYFNPLPHARRFMKREKWSYCTHTQRSLNVSHISVCVCANWEVIACLKNYFTFRVFTLRSIAQ